VRINAVDQGEHPRLLLLAHVFEPIDVGIALERVKILPRVVGLRHEELGPALPHLEPF
jgi:hypothetical protein